MNETDTKTRNCGSLFCALIMRKVRAWCTQCNHHKQFLKDLFCDLNTANCSVCWSVAYVWSVQTYYRFVTPRRWVAQLTS